MNREAANQKWRKWVGGALLGITAMYLLDPDRGRRRRSLLRNKLQSFAVKASDAVDLTVRDASNRLKGMQARISRSLKRLNNGSGGDDNVLWARVRSQLGRVVSHPHAIHVTAQQGRVTLSGPILANEKDSLLAAIRSIPGVNEIEDQLDVHQHSDHVSALQGGRPRSGSKFEFMQDNWTPAVRAVAILGGGALGLYALIRRPSGSIVLGAVGLGFLVRGVTNIPLKNLIGIRTGGQMIHLDKTIEVNAPVEDVFDFWTRYENFPYFMSHVQEVRDLGEGRSHWIVKGPAGARFDWNAVLTEWTRPEVVAWKSEPGSAVQHAGTVRFEPANGGTRISIHMSYSPPVGILGHSLAMLLGADPKHQMDEDLMRMKTFIETGVFPHDAARPAPQLSPVLH